MKTSLLAHSLRPLVAALLSASVCVAMAADPKASQFYEDALARYERSDFAGSIVQLKNALKIDRKMLPVQVLLGKALLANGEFVAAEVALEEAAKLGVNRAEIVVPLARAVIGQGKQAQVVDAGRFPTAALSGPVRVQLLLIQAGAFGDLGDPRQALKLVDEARALDTTNPATWLAEVPLRIRGGQLAEAKVAADKAVSLAPELADAHYQRGAVAHVSGDSKLALASYEKAIAYSKSHTEALVSRAGLLFDLGRAQEGMRDVDALLKADPREPRALYLKALQAERDGNTAATASALNQITGLLDPVPVEFLRYRPQLLMLGGLSHYGLKQFEKAKPYLEAIQRQQPNSGVSKLLAQIYLNDKNVDRAIESLDSFLKANPTDVQAVLLLASAHMAQGRYARATQLTQDALKRTDSPALRSSLGMSLVGSGKFKDAVAELELVQKQDPSNIQAGTALTTIYLQARQPTKAIRVAELLAKRHPENPGVLNLLGMSRAAGGNTAGSRQAFELAMKLAPTFSAPKIGLARLDASEGAVEAAVGRLNTVLATEERNVDALSEIGALFERRGQLSDAQRFFERADDHSGPSNLQPGLALVDFHLRHGKVDAAREALKRVSGKSPEAIPVLLASAQVAMASGDPGASKGLLTRASGLASYDVGSLLKIASLQMRVGHAAGAVHSLDKALKERPDFVPAQALMTEAEIRMGDLPKAEQRARQLVAQRPKEGIGHALLGDVLLERGQTPAALESYKRAHQIDQNSESFLRFFRAMTRVGSTEAVARAEQWLKAHPSDIGVRRVLADSLARNGDLPAARRAYEALLKVSPNDGLALNNLANVMLIQKDPGSLQVAERAAQQLPGAPFVLGTLGWAAFKAGQPDRALQLLRDARLRDPANAETRYFLGAVLAAAGRSAEAREELQASLRDGRGAPFAKEAEQVLNTLK